MDLDPALEGSHQRPESLRVASLARPPSALKTPAVLPMCALGLLRRENVTKTSDWRRSHPVSRPGALPSGLEATSMAFFGAAGTERLCSGGDKEDRISCSDTITYWDPGFGWSGLDVRVVQGQPTDVDKTELQRRRATTARALAIRPLSDPARGLPTNTAMSRVTAGCTHCLHRSRGQARNEPGRSSLGVSVGLPVKGILDDISPRLYVPGGTFRCPPTGARSCAIVKRGTMRATAAPLECEMRHGISRRQAEVSAPVAAADGGRTRRRFGSALAFGPARLITDQHEH
jgi:hypothetical protein